MKLLNDLLMRVRKKENAPITGFELICLGIGAIIAIGVLICLYIEILTFWWHR